MTIKIEWVEAPHSVKFDTKTMVKGIMTIPGCFSVDLYCNHRNIELIESKLDTLKSKAPKEGRGKQSKFGTKATKSKLKKRDGTKCFYCQQEMTEEQMSIEHILSKYHRGNSSMANCVLAHKNCNEVASNKSIIEKIEFRDSCRSFYETA